MCLCGRVSSLSLLLFLCSAEVCGHIAVCDAYCMCVCVRYAYSYLSLSAVVKLVKQDTGMRTATEHPICKCVCVCVSAVVKLVKQDTGMPTATHLFASVYA
jgi:hypothetical protein